VSREHPDPACVEVEFATSYALPPSAEVALEDYARALTRAEAASALPAATPASVRGVHLCSPESPPEAVKSDLEAFARGLAEASAERLGWA
jgi:hypothetical protein